MGLLVRLLSEGLPIQSIIIESDDFGITKSVSKGILTALDRGMITCTNAQVTATDFMPSVQLAQQQGINAMGIHLVLDRDRPISDPALIPSLVNKQGRLRPYATLSQQELSPAEVRLEFENQIQHFLASGLQLTHITSHHFVATLNLAIYQIVLALAKQYQVPLRNEWCVLNQVNQSAFKTATQLAAIPVSDALIMHQQQPYLTVNALTTQLTAVNDGSVPVILTHVGFLSQALRAKSSLTANRFKEWQTLASLSASQYYQRHALQRRTYQILTS